MKKGFTLIELLIVVAIIAILAAIAVPNFLEAQVRSKVSRAKADQRSYATGIETYYVDLNQYPVWARNGRTEAGLSFNAAAYPGGVNMNQIDSFAVKVPGTTDVNTLTTPIAYVTSYFPDPFMDTRGATFGYYCDSNGWVVWSAGPDTDQASGTDLGSASGDNWVETGYDSRVSQPSLTMLTGANVQAVTYDPTNGTVSPGDVWRVKQ